MHLSSRNGRVFCCVLEMVYGIQSAVVAFAVGQSHSIETISCVFVVGVFRFFSLFFSIFERIQSLLNKSLTVNSKKKNMHPFIITFETLLQCEINYGKI